MTTEILGFIIIVGAVIVFFARRQMQKTDEDTEVIEASAGRLRYELEQSANEIIGRMSGHIDHLENLLREADYKTNLLERRIEEFEQLQLDFQNQGKLGAGDSGSHLVENGDMQELPSLEEFNQFPQADLYEEEESSDSSNKMTEAQIKALEAIREASMALEAAQNELGVNDEDYDEETEDLEPEDTDDLDEVEELEEIEEIDEVDEIANLNAIDDTSEIDNIEDDLEPSADESVEEPDQVPEDFESVLQEALAEEADVSDMPDVPDVAEEADVLEESGEALITEEPPVVFAEPDEEEVIQKYIAQELTRQEDGGENNGAPSDLTVEEATIIAKKLLIAGFEPEEVSKMTGLSMGAINLLEMVK